MGAAASAGEQDCPGCVARLLAPLQDMGLDLRLDAGAEGRLAAEIARLADAEAAASGRTRSQILDEVEAVFRARRRGIRRPWPRFDAGALLDSELVQGSMRLASQMFQLFRRFAAAYVSAAAEEAVSESAAKSLKTSVASGTSSTTPATTATTTTTMSPLVAASLPESKAPSTASPSPASSRTKTRSQGTNTKTATADSDDDADDDDADDSDEENDDEDSGKADNGNARSKSRSHNGNSKHATK
ncbi:hypothetical protein IWQ57_005482 [Coemansia nantahalensis]|uniref:Uncharacterized protein n=1 Tax=Coemansia nantahalensis TaxID=2789366 RepID=A0ACC1JMF2_9FUNG|nr:hypothetical protein IWQ57_005482 [Coemansia nantahalensis]